MKKIGLFALLLSLSLGIMGCNKDTTKKNPDNPPPPANTGDGTKPPDSVK